MKQQFEKEVRGYEIFFYAHYKVEKEIYQVDGIDRSDDKITITDIETIQVFRDASEVFDSSVIKELENDLKLMELENEIANY